MLFIMNLTLITSDNIVQYEWKVPPSLVWGVAVHIVQNVIQLLPAVNSKHCTGSIIASFLYIE